MDKSATTIIASTTIGAGETTDLSACTRIDNSRTTQLSISLRATINAASTESIFVYIYTSDDNIVYSSKWHDSWEIDNCREIGFTSGDKMFMPEETITAAAGGTGTVVGWELDSGTWAGGDAVGVIHLEDITGTFTDGQALTGGTSGCSALQSGDIASHALHEQYLSMSPVPLYMKCRIHNGDVGVSATLCSLTSIKQTI